MLFGEKVGNTNEMENSSKRLNDTVPPVDPFSFTALHFLRNRLMPSDISRYHNLQSPHNPFQSNQALPPLETILPLSKLSQAPPPKLTTELPQYSPVLSVKSSSLSPDSLKSSPMINSPHSSIFCNPFVRRPRGEKRPIPDEQKDEKYFERRRRNNEAAKKSRDARKLREDRIALRAAILEQENSILRAQTLALREEVCTLRQILCNRTISNNLNISSNSTQS